MRVYMAQYLILLLLYLEAVRSGTNSNESSSGCELAYRNCSQKLRRFDGDNEFFNCVVGGKDELIKFNKTISQSKDSATLFDAPDLLGVSCFKNSEINPSQAIEVTFRLPRAIYPRVSDGNSGHYQFPKAIYLNLSEVREEAYSHPGFYKCHRERIFIFHKYFPRLNYDADNPRILSNRYMLGLHTSNHTNAYILSLTTAEGRSRDFYITLPVRDTSSSNWRPAVATYLNVTQGTIQVIVEPQPRIFTYRGFNVTMCSEDRCSEPNTIDSRETNSTKFENITHGVYYVKVMSNTCAGAYTCPEVISYTVDALGIPKIADKFQPVPIAVIVAGSVVGVAVGVTVLIILTFCLRRGGSCAQTRRTSDKKPRGIVIHPFLDVSRSKSNTDRKYVKVMEDFQNFIVKAFDCELVPIPVGCLNCNKTALDKLFSGLVFVIVVCADNNSNPYF